VKAVLVLVAAFLVAGCDRKSDAAGCDLASRTWEQTSPGACATSKWKFTPQTGGTWHGAETGCANAGGTARYDGKEIKLDFEYSGGVGQYIWPVDAQCRASAGKVTWSKGPLAGQSAASTLSPSK